MAFAKIKEYLLSKQQDKLVYRFISEREKRAIEANDLSKIGRTWNSNTFGNNHKYKQNTRYIHFFDNKNDAKLLYKELGFSKEYLCTYSIPAKILKKHQGNGYYMVKGYEIVDTVKEYAIPSDEFDLKWVDSIMPITDFVKGA